MERELKVATNRLIDKVWTLLYYENEDGTIEIVSHSRNLQQGYDSEGKVYRFHQQEGENRTIIGIHFYAPDSRWAAAPTKTVKVSNPKYVFDYE